MPMPCQARSNTGFILVLVLGRVLREKDKNGVVTDLVLAVNSDQGAKVVGRELQVHACKSQQCKAQSDIAFHAVESEKSHKKKMSGVKKKNKKQKKAPMKRAPGKVKK